MQKLSERLVTIAAEGQAGQYGLVVRGKPFTANQIDALDSTEIEKLYARYEARLGAVMTKTLGSAALQLYAGIAAMFLPIPAENQPGLIADLEGDPFVGHAFSSATCELYNRYGVFLAPFTAALTTLKHCQFGYQCPVRISDGGDGAGEPRDKRRSQHRVCLDLTVSSSSWGLGRAAVCDCSTPWTFLLPFFSVERVTEPRQEKVKDPKKVAAGRAGAAARKTKQERLLEQLRGTKESFRLPAGDGTPANIPPKEADQEQAVSADKRPEHNRRTN